jgi:hypothetical protein
VSANRIRQLVVFACAGLALLLSASAASPARSHAGQAAFIFSVAPMLPPAIVGMPYPPKPYPKVSACKPAPKESGACGPYTFKLSKKAGNLPGGLDIDPKTGIVSGVARWNSDILQPKNSPKPGLYKFQICARANAKTVCKPTQLAVFSGFNGSWAGDFQGDPGAFACNTPLSGSIKLKLTQKVTIVKGVPTSTLTGTATLSDLPPIMMSTEDHNCEMAPQTFRLSGGKVGNPSVGGEDSGNGLFNFQVTPTAQLTGNISVEDGAKTGLFSSLSFTAQRTG